MSGPKFKYSKWWLLVGCLLLFNIALAVAVRKAAPKSYASLEFFDVGQGDGIYLRTPSGNDVVIDTGPGDVILEKLGKALSPSDRTIELVILTHPHADHISGMTEILKRYRVEKVLLPEATYETETAQALGQLLMAEGAQVIRPALGKRLVLDAGVVLDILYPFVEGRIGEAKDINDVSVVARLSYGDTNVFLTGDAGKDIEQMLVRLGLPLEAEILKVAHHGSRHSTSGEFVDQVTADYAVVLVGKNSYGHPHEEVLGFLQERNIPVLRTDERGDIRFKIYPNSVELLTN